mgnify:CR=1 FL=1
MTEPSSIGLATLNLSIVITGTIIGAQTDALAVGLMAGVLVSLWLHEVNSYRRAISAMLFSSVLAGYLSPFLSDWASAQWAIRNGDALRLAISMLIGAAAPSIFPLLLRRGESAVAVPGQEDGK